MRGRAALAVTAVSPALLLAPMAQALSPPRIYWANSSLSTIGEAKLDGTRVKQRFIRVNGPYGVAVDGSHIYWANAHALGEANLNGTAVKQRFIRANQPFGVAVSSSAVSPVER